MFFFMFRVRPKTAPSKLNDTAGAYVNCWISLPTETEAVTRAKEYIDSNDWIVEELEEVKFVTAKDYLDSKDGVEYFEQALIDGEVFVFHNWPLCEEEEDALQ